jgi:GT2 family glycosyltransferase
MAADSQVARHAAGGEAPTRIAAAIACHNRRERTLRCLRDLLAQRTPNLRISVHLLDDASSDGTAAAVAENFPEVDVLRGTGSRFWSGGMVDAMTAAAANEFDYLLLLNDDVELRHDAMRRMLDAHAQAVLEKGPGMHIIVGAFVDPDSGALTYSGFVRRSRWHPVRLEQALPRADALVACDTMNGNCVLIPQAVVRRIGIIDDAFVHQLGDLDYGYRAVEAGARIWIAPDAMGTCAIGVRPRRWADPSLSIAERWRLINAPLGWPLKPWLQFMWRHGGVAGVAVFLCSYAKALAGVGDSPRRRRKRALRKR